MMVENMVGYRSFTVVPIEGQVYVHYWKLLAAFVFIWTAPNVLQLFAEWNPTLSKPHSPGGRWTYFLRWGPTPAWGIAMGILAALAVLAISGQTEFLYFRF